jgi:2'-5' RNA ligase
MRAFVAINLPSAVRIGMWEAAEPLRAGDFPFRWVRPESLHLTVKFLGQVAAGREAEIIAGLVEAGRGTRVFNVSIGGFGAFPSPKRPRVVWVGLEGVPALEMLQHRVEQEMESLGFALEGRPFRPHITLGRVRRDTRASELAGFEATLDRLEYAGEALVASLDLMQSELHRDGARYAVRHRVEFDT